MKTYIARYVSPKGDNPVNGVFEFESEHRLNSKQNIHDARLAMLEMYGKSAISYTITSVQVKRETDGQLDGQMALDFREPTRRHRKTFRRGIG